VYEEGWSGRCTLGAIVAFSVRRGIYAKSHHIESLELRRRGDM
jgi:hypothetical protein